MNNPQQTPQPLDLEHYWMPYTNNRAFKSSPRMIASAEGMYYTTIEGKKVLDGRGRTRRRNRGSRPACVSLRRSSGGSARR